MKDTVWISVKDKLPPHSSHVLAALRFNFGNGDFYYNLINVRYNDKKKLFEEGLYRSFKIDVIDYWMPIPHFPLAYGERIENLFEYDIYSPENRQTILKDFVKREIGIVDENRKLVVSNLVDFLKCEELINHLGYKIVDDVEHRKMIIFKDFVEKDKDDQ